MTCDEILSLPRGTKVEIKDAAGLLRGVFTHAVPGSAGLGVAFVTLDNGERVMTGARFVSVA
jgi:hypothetical protein